MENSSKSGIDIKRMNRNKIFKLIHECEKVSRQEIVDALDLSLPTVNQNIKSLLKDGLILEMGNYESTGGRKATTFTVNNRAKVALSISINPDSAHFAVVGLKGDSIIESVVKAEFVPDDSYIQTIIYEASATIDALIRSGEIKECDVLGIGITIPGTFDEETNIVTYAPPLGIKNFDAGAFFKDSRFKCRAMNDARAHAFAEYWANKKLTNLSNNKDRLYVMIGDGVGGAVITEKGIRKGEHNRCGEYGHMTIHPGGELCTCGKRGCLESYISERIISKNLGLSLKEFFDIVKGNKNAKTDKDCKKIFAEYLNDLALGINNLFCIFDGDIIIGGSVAPYLKEYEKDLKDILKKNYAFETDASYVKFPSLPRQKEETGAALMFIDEFINDI